MIGPGTGFAALALVDGLERFGNLPALLSENEEISYAELAQRVTDVADRLGTQRRLVLVHAANTVDAVVSYLGALRGGHPVILADSTKPALIGELTRTFDPDVVVGAGAFSERREGTRHDLHPDLAVLLSTSGSTGSPKLVRLSHDNLQSNAEAIAEYLELRHSDRAITSLPLGYCYGLSVLHSHLQSGASVVLTERSVIDPGFWRVFEQTRATSFAGVPHTFALLDRLDIAWYTASHLRYVTQAGGRMPSDDVRRIGQLGAANGWQLFVMYGQTEATARMAYLPPSELQSHPHCVGRAVPGGQLHIESPGPDGTGELVYTGPNVMMGYAETLAALADGPGVRQLRTGDLARRTATGLFEIVGRRSRFAKLLGHRIDLDRLQASLTPLGGSVVCASDDHQLVVAMTSGDPALLRRRAVRGTGLPPGLIRIRQYAEVPRLSNGKPDYETIKAPDTSAPRPAADRVATIQTVFAESLGYDRVDPSASFVELGGDSLSYVEASARLEDALGTLPLRWAELPVRDLAAVPATSPQTPETISRVDTSVLLRAISIALIVFVHLEVWGVRGGGHLLLGLAGFAFARFPLTAVRLTNRITPLAAAIARLALPSMAFIAAVVALSDRYGLPNVFLMNHYFGPPGWSERWNFWFVEALVEILVAALLLLSIPAVRRFERRHTLLLPSLILGAGLLVRYDAFGWSDIAQRFGRPHTVFWIFALGWLVERAGTTVHRAAVSIVVLATLWGYFPEEPLRVLIVQLGLLMLLWLPRVPLPRLLAPLVSRVAAASLWIYLTHWIVWPYLANTFSLPRAVVAVACIAAGVGAASVADVAQSRVIGMSRLARRSVFARRQARVGSVRWQQRRPA
ncbi:MAG TPA: non-ribosomal peptide synthetase [Propionibacteriaceae bacterium]|nr:non-ribosomal peptide synthetase [Propionibacteriaceae bacterium]